MPDGNAPDDSQLVDSAGSLLWSTVLDIGYIGGCA